MIEDPEIQYNLGRHLLHYNPLSGEPMHSVFTADEWRAREPNMVWLFNPWNGDQRHTGDVRADKFGILMGE